MEEQNAKLRRWNFLRRRGFRYAVVLLCAVVAVGIAFMQRGRRQPPSAPEPLVRSFYRALAALDVDENERAVEILNASTKAFQQEPALWSNLAIAQIRLRDLSHARVSLDRAKENGSHDPRVQQIEVDYYEAAGMLEQAIVALRRLYETQERKPVHAYRLYTLLNQMGEASTAAERRSLIEALYSRMPENLPVRCEYARIAAANANRDRSEHISRRFHEEQAGWSDTAIQQLAQLDQAIESEDWPEVALSVTFLENVLKPTSDYQSGLAQLNVRAAAAAGIPIREFIYYELPAVAECPADRTLRFSVESLGLPSDRVELVRVVASSPSQAPILVVLADGKVRLGDTVATYSTTDRPSSAPSAVAVTDWNFDAFPDVAIATNDAIQLFVQGENGTFSPVDISPDLPGVAISAAWPLDLDADGDLDLIAADATRQLLCWINRGDGTTEIVQSPFEVTSVVDVMACDFDKDADIDVVTLDGSGSLVYWVNHRAGAFVPRQLPLPAAVVAAGVSDVDLDGYQELAFLATDHKLYLVSLDDDDRVDVIATVTGRANTPLPTDGSVRLHVADLDNNAIPEVVVSEGERTVIVAQQEDGGWMTIQALPMRTDDVADMDQDGLVDLVGTADGEGVVATNQCNKTYHYLELSLLTAQQEGDRRINAFGMGARVDVRAATQLRSYSMSSPQIHIGLGRHEVADVIRIYWPNGTLQAEFDVQGDASIAAAQRLKGSCPWVFVHDGQEFRFIKDFLWRSPLGLRINGQQTAGIVQTKDCIKVPRSAWAEVDGKYLFRITAELWETHFFDHISLQVVDHSSDVDVLVDERFVPNRPQSEAFYFLREKHAFDNVVNDAGQSAVDLLRQVDGVYEDRFPLGAYQGIAKEHWIEFELPRELDSQREILLIGNGWVYPTDSSLNVAVAQSESTLPYGLILEQYVDEQVWRVVDDQVGFPAGKMKDCVIRIPEHALQDSRRFRLRTNLEVYWDALAWGYSVADMPHSVTVVRPEPSELRYRGFSFLNPLDRRRPDVPIYRVRTTTQQWPDLAGYYTRYGDIQPLLRDIDDRYVIMNAGDEIVLEFSAPPRPRPSMARDLFLVGDGWVKDGDLNTVASATVKPLPTHAASDYVIADSDDSTYDNEVTDDANDSKTYHTRYVTPAAFVQGLWTWFRADDVKRED